MGVEHRPGRGPDHRPGREPARGPAWRLAHRIAERLRRRFGYTWHRYPPYLTVINGRPVIVPERLVMRGPGINTEDPIILDLYGLYKGDVRNPHLNHGDLLGPNVYLRRRN